MPWRPLAPGHPVRFGSVCGHTSSICRTIEKHTERLNLRAVSLANVNVWSVWVSGAETVDREKTATIRTLLLVAA